MSDDAALHEAVRAIVNESRGQIRLCWLVDCVNLGLCSAEFAHNFLLDFHSVMTGMGGRFPLWPGKWFEEVWTQCCVGSDLALYRKQGYLREGPPIGLDANEFPLFSTVMRFSDWEKFHAGKSTNTDGGISPVANGHRAVGMDADDFERTLNAGPAGWWTEGRWLGRPPTVKGSGWFSGHRHSNVGEFLALKPGRSDVLSRGLWPSQGAWSEPWVRYTVNAQELVASGLSCGRRPLFCDLGSVWFKIRPLGPNGRVLAHSDWGQTTDLRLGAASLLEDTGAPERVVFSIPLSHPAVQRPMFVAADMPEKVMPDSKILDQALKNGRTSADIEQQVLNLFV